jgi:hypothetical protein
MLLVEFEVCIKPNIQVSNDCEVNDNELIPNNDLIKQHKVQSCLETEEDYPRSFKFVWKLKRTTQDHSKLILLQEVRKTNL